MGHDQAGTLDMSDGMFRDAMNHGMDASTHIHDVASGEHEGLIRMLCGHSRLEATEAKFLSKMWLRHSQQHHVAVAEVA